GHKTGRLQPALPVEQHHLPPQRPEGDNEYRAQQSHEAVPNPDARVTRHGVRGRGRAARGATPQPRARARGLRGDATHAPARTGRGRGAPRVARSPPRTPTATRGLLTPPAATRGTASR